MTRKRESSKAARTLAGSTLLGLLCGLAAAGVFAWWWSSQPKSYVRYGGSYEPLDVATALDSPFIDLGAADPWPTLFVALIGVPTAVGLLAGLLAVLLTRARHSRSVA